MTLATKNGSLIVKDGSIAEDCGCCGGWFCCNTTADICSMADGIDRVVVTVSGGQDRKRVVEESAPFLDCPKEPTVYAKQISITPVQRYFGTFTLERVAVTQWAHSFAPDDAGGEGGLSLTVSKPAEYGDSALGEFGWRLELSGVQYMWQKMSRNQISESKELSDMMLARTIISGYTPCYTTPFEMYEAAHFSFGPSGRQAFVCRPLPVRISTTLSLNVLSGGFSFGEKGPPRGYTRAVADTGSSVVSISLEITTKT